MDRHLIQLSTPVHCTAAQQRCLDTLARETQELRARLCAWHATQVFGPEGPRRVSQAVVPPISRAAVERQVHRLADGAALPAATVAGVAHAFHKSVRSLAGQRVYPSQLPQPGPEPRVPLDADVIALDPYHVHVAGWPDLLVTDLWRLPLGLMDALLCSGAQALADLAEQATLLRARDQAGDPTALIALQAFAHRHAPVMGHQGRAATVRREQPHRSGHATLHQQEAPDGTRHWVITWSIRVPAGWLPRAGQRDVVGVDPGVRHPLAWCDGTRAGYMERGPLTGSTAPIPAGAAPTTLFADAVRRHAWFARTATALDRALRLLLTYEAVAIEDTNWANLADDGNAWPREVMHLTGMTDVLPWLRALAPVTGTRIVRVPAWHASQGCGKCGGRGTRDIASNEFRCRRCTHQGCADVNAAMYARLVTLLGQARP